MTTTRAAQKDATRRRILAAGRAAFAAEGYEAVSLATLVAGLDVTKGAFYHHFRSKAELFLAVLADVVDEVGRRVDEAAESADPWVALIAGSLAYLDTATDPAVRRILLEDGPAVVGWATWLDLDAAQPAARLHEALTDLAAAGTLVDVPVDALTRLLSGAMSEAAMWIATSSDRAAARERAGVALVALLDGIRRA